MARIAIVASVLAPHDAVTTAVRDTAAALSSAGHEVELFALRNDFRNLIATVVDDVVTLLMHPRFQAADLVVHHFAIYSPLFDAMIALADQVPQIAVFHNITPVALVVPTARPVIEQSFRQLHNLRCVDRVWAVSETNADVLTAHDFDRDKIEIMPLAVERPSPASLADKSAPPVELLFVGRFVPSKGTIDLVAALDEAHRRTSTPLRLRLVGNLDFSDPGYVAEIRRQIALRRLDATIEFLGEVDDARLARLYHRSHLLAIPSYHEGFCVPVIEGLRAGCIPVGYAAHNLPAIANGLGRMVMTGDPDALAWAIAETAGSIASGSPLRLDRGIMSRAGFDHAARDYIRRFAHAEIARKMAASVDLLLSRRASAA